MADFVITTYPVTRRKYLIEGVDSVEEAWEKYMDLLPTPFEEKYMDEDGDEPEIEEVDKWAFAG